MNKHEKKPIINQEKLEILLNDSEINKMDIKSEQLFEKIKKYHNETNKNAIWRGTITDNFKKWLKGEDIYNLNRARISLYVPEETKEKWENYKNNHGFSTLSKLIREAVDKFINDNQNVFKPVFSDSEILAELSHSLKEPLTTIKGFSQLILKNFQEKIDLDLQSIIKNIFNQSIKLETKINTLLADNAHKNTEIDVLLVEDDLATVKLVTTYLSSKGLICKGIMSGIIALEELKHIKPKVIFLDIILPDMRGSDICKAIKSNQQYRDIPVYFLTAIPLNEVKKIVAETHANGYILKPFDLSEFDIVLQQHIKN
ncbi:MAG: response regulator [Promethearchaeota archaeon]